MDDDYDDGPSKSAIEWQKQQAKIDAWIFLALVILGLICAGIAVHDWL